MTVGKTWIGRMAAAVVLLGAASGSARADLVLSTFPVPQASQGFFNLILTNTPGMTTGPVSFEAFDVLLSVGPNSVVTNVTGPSQQVPNNPPFPFFNNPNGVYSYVANPFGDPTQALLFGALDAGQPVYTLQEGESIQLGTVFYQPTIIPNGGVVDPITIVSGLSTVTVSGDTTAGSANVGIVDVAGGNNNDPTQIGSIFIPEPTTMLAFAGLLGLGAVAARRRKAA